MRHYPEELKKAISKLIESGLSLRQFAQRERHKGEDQRILAKRTELYAKAKERNPSRWSGETRNWDKIESVELNPENKKEAA